MTKVKLNHAHALDLLSGMIRIRRFEEKCYELYTQEHIRGFLHLYDGEEAIAVGVSAALEERDRVVSTYREHGHALARGMSMESALAEMYGKATGCAGGRGGSMHLFDQETNLYGGNAIVGGGLPLAVGLGLGDAMQGKDRVTVCFFGDGALAEGAFHESMNLAALWKLPVLFVLENNLYAMGTAVERVQANTDFTARAASYGMPAESVDGNDVVSVEAAARRLVEAIRAGEGPQFLHCRTYRTRPHSMFDAEKYRDKAEVADWRRKSPITRYQSWLVDNGLVRQDEIDAIEAEVEAQLRNAVAACEQAPWEPVEDLARHTVAETRPAPPQPLNPGRMVDSTYRDCCRAAITDAMLRDERVFMMGEDIGAYGGCYAVSTGLLAEFGTDRIRDTPLAEGGFTGAGIGAALAGMRPIVEIMTVNFSLLALDQILNTAASLRHMSGGQFGVPLVIRMATGAGRQLAAQHSHSLENYYAHIPGLRVVAPATLEDARGMLWTALADPDPVIMFEHVMLYNMAGQIAKNAGAVDIDRAVVRRKGRDVTLISWSLSMWKALEAAEELVKHGIEAEVIDLRSLRPIDDETIMESVARTRRAVVVDESWRTGSLAGEIAARVQEHCFWHLDAPVGRVCAAEVPVPYPKHLETAVLPQVADIVAAVKALPGVGQ
ncbi:MAG: pyruvate dehydrogenase (acetyl-transferring) E1 component subunit alpha [Pseudotabrizicola sp.]|uniref:pyruvate dehydrogenase (acetyl-transferring) E1 component subunit alpha n=1 Tax=Pseudotabrizicola sp. TaxID=2939647 RepID=UPI002731D490|nr:pyruvate dehydrogenase (acetyl-transferring) E1 component subunit alpha [Pseudotabrizicola sp.]MDP2080830.1 pyruvate dehydrogenase (acetyl-transferring) E1 component subunit alpha [Pseudotabrizicola sp.]MDZ7572768.1 pyruvate dehydrogenase (acetyl-transferring) E1 component subunit alpha [Pseudotabrizicola sp.]